MKLFFWPSIETMAEADNSARDGAGVSFLVAAFTALITYLETNEMIDAFPSVDPSNYIAAAFFTGIGCMLLRCSRIAAIAGLLFYTAEQILFAVNTGISYVNLVAILIVISFVNSVRATFKYHAFMKRYTKKETVLAGSESGGPAEAELPPKKRFNGILPAGAALGTALLCVVFFAANGKERAKTSIESPYAETESAAAFDPLEPENAGAAAGAKVSFKLKNGQTVSGKIKYEDEIYYTIQTMTGEEIVIKEDIVP